MDLNRCYSARKGFSKTYLLQWFSHLCLCRKLRAQRIFPTISTKSAKLLNKAGVYRSIVPKTKHQASSTPLILSGCLRKLPWSGWSLLIHSLSRKWSSQRLPRMKLHPSLVGKYQFSRKVSLLLLGHSPRQTHCQQPSPKELMGITTPQKDQPLNNPTEASEEF